jgi:hypothetical protein
VSEEFARQLRASIERVRREHTELNPFVLACPSSARTGLATFAVGNNLDVIVVGDAELSRIPNVEEVAIVGEGIVPVPSRSGDSRQFVDAYIDHDSMGVAWSEQPYLLG